MALPAVNRGKAGVREEKVEMLKIIEMLEMLKILQKQKKY